MQTRRNINQSPDSDDDDERSMSHNRSSVDENQSTAHGLPIDYKTFEDEDRETRPLLAEYIVEPAGSDGFLCGKMPSRYVLAIWAFFGFFCLYSMRVNLSVAIVAMTAPEHASNKSAPACPLSESNSTNKSSHFDFDWNPQVQGFILGGFFYGYIVTQIVVGNIAEKYGAKWVFGGTILVTAILTLLTPLAARQSYGLLIALRVVMGMCSGPAFPSAAALWGKWIPPGERSTVPPASQTGTSMGIIFTTPLTSIMIGANFLGGWPSAFYVFGILSIIWFVGWCFFGFSSPAEHPRISAKERQYLSEQVPNRPKTHRKTPWKHIMTCLPVYGIAINHVCYNFIYYTLLTTLPTYFSTILNFDLHQSGFLFALPYIAQLLMTFISGYIVDRLRARKTFSITTLRRAQTIIGTLGACGFLVAIGYMGCNSTWAVVCCIISVGFLGFHTSGPIISHLDVASNYSGTLVGITNSLATIPGFVGPAIVGAITNNNQTVQAWRIIFNSFAGIGLFGCICYCILFNGEEQPWNRIVDEEQPVYEETSE